MNFSKSISSWFLLEFPHSGNHTESHEYSEKDWDEFQIESLQREATNHRSDFDTHSD
jgi:hypothetical protein